VEKSSHLVGPVVAQACLLMSEPKKMKLNPSKSAIADYEISDGQVPNPDTTETNRPAVTPDEAKQIKERLTKENK